MPYPLQIALVGDHDPGVTAHQAIPQALALAAEALGRPVQPKWVPTDAIDDALCLAPFDGIWCVPASPYRSMAGALTAIRFARETPIPFLGTCGGFQHAVVEYARNVLGWADADHGETAPEGARLVIAPLACSLVEVSNTIRLAPNSRVARAYGAVTVSEGYHCRYGLNPEFARELTAGPLGAVAWDDTGEIRAIELDGHPFFVATLFQPERAALRPGLPPLVATFVRAAAGHSRAGDARRSTTWGASADD
ncbi:MAG: CTP synthase [Gemmatimonadales bacterium]